MTEHRANAPAAPSDRVARERAIDPGASFIVQAPAGSGKTGLLTQRFLRLLAVVRAPEEILAITFTRKAAAEMRQRIFAALATASGPEPEADHEQRSYQLACAARDRDRALDWGLMSSPNRLRIKTIDSLCAELASAFPVATELGAAPGVLEDTAASTAAYLAAARQTLGRSADRTHGEPVRTVLAHLDNDLDRGARLIADMLKRRDHWLRHIAAPDSERLQRARLERALGELARERLQTLADRLPADVRRELHALAAYAGTQLAAAGRSDHPLAIWSAPPVELTPTVDQLPWWQALLGLLLTNDDGLRQRVNVRDGFPAGEKSEPADAKRIKREMKTRFGELRTDLARRPGMVAALRDLRHLPPLTYQEPQWELVAALYRVLLLAAAELQLVFAETGRVDFVEMQWRALQALGESDRPTDLALVWDCRLSHILVDEFQDTSYGQFALLTRLCAGWQPADGRTLFLVGDPMQSIYRFREAEVGLYLQAWRHGIGDLSLERLTLTSNFRAQGGLVTWLNSHFAPLFPDRADIAGSAVPYAPATATRPELAGTAVQIHPRVGRDDSAEAEQIAGLVDRERSRDAGGDVAILVRARSQIPPLAAALQAAGIRYQGVDTEPLAQRQYVTDLHSLTRALLDPADRVAWLALLRSPWCGLLLADLLVLCEVPRAPLWQRMTDDTVCARLSADGRARLQRLRPLLAEHLAQRRRLPLQRAVAALWRALGGEASATARDTLDATAYFELLARHQRAGVLDDPATFVQALDSLYAPADNAETGVQIMTMHKAKGLEFDVVILPGLGRSAPTDGQPLLRWLERPNAHGELDLLLAPIRTDGDEESIAQGLSYLERERTDHEALRLLYVAATRARHRLHLFGHVAWNAGREAISPPPSGALLAHLWPVLESAFDGLEPAPEATQTVSPPDPPRLRRTAPDWSPQTPPPAIERARRHDGAGTAPTAIEFDWAGESARVIGVLVHRWLERFVTDGVSQWPSARVADQLPSLKTALLGLGLCADRVDEAAQTALGALVTTLEDPRGRWLLDDHAASAVEWPLTLWENGAPRHVVIDRSFVADDIRWIVDYKTSRHEGGRLAEFLDSEQRRYRAQLDTYARALTALESQPIRCALYFPVFAGWREWAPDIMTTDQ